MGIVKTGTLSLSQDVEAILFVEVMAVVSEPRR
jgi:hypothetical protein